MTGTMAALVYEGPHQMNVREVARPHVAPDEVLIRIAYSGICGSELYGYLGKNALRKPPLIMGHEFSGTIEQIGDQAALNPDLKVGQRVTANPLVSCNRCRYCLNGQQQLCPQRKLHSAGLPGSNAQYMTIRADAIVALPDDFDLADAALTEPAAVAVHAARLAAPEPHESALIVGAGPIGLLTIQALQARGMKTIYVADLNAERLEMAQSLGAIPVATDALKGEVDITIEAVGVPVTRQACVAATRSGGKIIWMGLHEAESELHINDIIRREITAYGSFAYNPLDFQHALTALVERRLWLERAWTRVEPLANGTACFEELLAGGSAAKIWLVPPES
jgi:2-desacetyl-2-hydroxyethyl bacteriochlorophyllide A dehydrogenase